MRGGWSGKRLVQTDNILQTSRWDIVANIWCFFALSYTSNANLRDSKEDFSCILYVYFDVEEEVLFHGDI